MAGGTSKKVGIVTASIVASTWLASWIYQVAREKADRKRFPPPGELIDIGGRRIHVTRAGNKKPIVVVLPWLGGFGLQWIKIQRLLSSHATVYVVDRAGFGWSDSSRGPQTPHRIVRDLQALLDALSITEPVILVGHSYGGLSARLYAARYPERVKGLILLESSHEDQIPQFSRLPGQEVIRRWITIIKLQAKWRGIRRLRVDLGFNKELLQKVEQDYPKEFRDAALSRYLSFSYRRAYIQELIGMTYGNRSVRREAQHYGDLPITVVTGGIGGRNRPGWYETWLKLQESFMNLSHSTNRVWAPENGHGVNLENPELVAQAINDLIDRIPESNEI